MDSFGGGTCGRAPARGARPSRPRTRRSCRCLSRPLRSGGLNVDSQAPLTPPCNPCDHSAHFNSAFQAEFTQFNIALASQLAAMPLPLPASGLHLHLRQLARRLPALDPELRADPHRARRDDRQGQVHLRHHLPALHLRQPRGADLDSIPAVFTHDDAQLGGGRSDVVTTTNAIEANVDQCVLFLSYGLGSRVDLSLGVPFVYVT